LPRLLKDWRGYHHKRERRSRTVDRGLYLKFSLVFNLIKKYGVALPLPLPLRGSFKPFHKKGRPESRISIRHRGGEVIEAIS
jgi:hypothetical protein